MKNLLSYLILLISMLSNMTSFSCGNIINNKYTMEINSNRWIISFNIIDKKKKVVTNLLPSEIILILKDKFTNWQILTINDLKKDTAKFFQDNYPKSAPGIVKADLDGNKLDDFALLLKLVNYNKSESSPKLVIFMQISKGKYKYYTPQEEEVGFCNPDLLNEISDDTNNTFIRKINKNININYIAEDDTIKTTRLKYETIEIVYFESASRVYYWNKTRFSYYQTSD